MSGSRATAPSWSVLGVSAPSNGRGTFYKAVKFALADYSGVAEPDLFMERHGAHPTGEMTLRGMRLAVMSESGRTYHKQGAR